MMNITKPVGAKITLSEICNHRCTFCYNKPEVPDFDDQRRMDYQRLTKEEYDRKYDSCEKNLVKIIDILGENEIFYVKFTGGEPLAMPELLFKGLEACKRHGMKKILNTNLSMLSSEAIERFQEYELDRLNVTFLSHKEQTYNNLTRSTNYKTVLKNIRNAIEEEFDIEAGIPIAKENIEDVYDTIEFLKAEGIKRISVFPVDPARKDQIPLMPTLEDMEIILRQMKKADSGIILNSVTSFPLCFVIDHKEYAKYLASPCRMGTEEVSFVLNGDIKGCSATKQVYGNILKDGFSAVLKVNEMFKNRKNAEVYPQECKECEVIEECTLGCKAANEGTSGKIYGNNRFATGPKKQKDLLTREDCLHEGKINIGLSEILARKENDTEYLIFSLNKGICMLTYGEIELIKTMQQLKNQDLQEFYEKNYKNPGKIRNLFIKLKHGGILW